MQDEITCKTTIDHVYSDNFGDLMNLCGIVTTGKIKCISKVQQTWGFVGGGGWRHHARGVEKLMLLTAHADAACLL